HDLELGDAARAEEAYLRVLSLDPKDPEALEALDRIYQASGMWSELAEVLKRRVEIAISTDDLVSLMFRLGRVQSAVLGDTDAARTRWGCRRSPICTTAASNGASWSMSSIGRSSCTTRPPTRCRSTSGSGASGPSGSAATGTRWTRGWRRWPSIRRISRPCGR